MQLTPYLNFDGDCAEAFRFYAQVLGGELVGGMQTHGESPVADQVPAEWHDRIIHARLEVGGAVLMGSDTPPGDYQPQKTTWVSIRVDDAAEADRIFEALADGGAVTMPIGQTFWAERFGMVVDRFGTPWMVNYEGAARAAAG